MYISCRFSSARNEWLNVWFLLGERLKVIRMEERKESHFETAKIEPFWRKQIDGNIHLCVCFFMHCIEWKIKRFPRCEKWMSGAILIFPFVIVGNWKVMKREMRCAFRHIFKRDSSRIPALCSHWQSARNVRRLEFDSFTLSYTANSNY